MRIAITSFQERVSPLFDTATTILVLDLDGGREVAREALTFEGADVGERIDRLLERGIEMLLCGGIRMSSLDRLERRGVRVCPWVAGRVDAVLSALRRRLAEVSGEGAPRGRAGSGPARVAVAASGEDLTCDVAPSLGRCPYVLLVDPTTGALEALPNPHRSSPGVAGSRTARWLVRLGVAAVLAGRCGPNAAGLLCAGGISIHDGVDGPAGQAIERYRLGEFAASARVAGPDRGSSRAPSTAKGNA